MVKIFQSNVLTNADELEKEINEWEKNNQNIIVDGRLMSNFYSKEDDVNFITISIFYRQNFSHR